MSSERSPLRQIAIMVRSVLSPEARNDTEAEQNRRMERFRAELQRIVGDGFDIRITVNGGCLEAVIEDLRFVAYEFVIPKTQEPITAVTLLGRCPTCGAETMSKPFHSLEGLGKTLEMFEPTLEHYCYSPQKASRRY